MPAYFTSGFSVRTPAWHGLGTVLGEYPEDWDDAREKAGLEWEPVERPQFATRFVADFSTCRGCTAKVGAKHRRDCEVGDAEARMKVELVDALPPGSVVGDDGRHVFVPDSGFKQIQRSDSGLILGVPSSEFSLITHGRKAEYGTASMEQIIEMFVGEGVKFETAGSCREGRYVWALMYLDEPYKVPGDSEHLPFMALLNSHDGGGACKLTKTQVRVVCWNTWQMASAEGDRHGQQIVFRHTGDVSQKITEAQATIADLRTDQQHYVELAKMMLAVKATDRQRDSFLEEFIPNPAEHGEQVSDRVQGNINLARATWKAIHDKSVTCEDIAGSAWGVVQASSEYLDYTRRYRNTDSLLGRSILNGEPMKAKVLSICGDLFASGLKRQKSPWAERLTEMGEEHAMRREHRQARILGNK